MYPANTFDSRLRGHGQQSAISGWVRERYRYLLLPRKSRRCSRPRSRSGRAQDRSTTNCGETFCLVICLSFVWMFLFPSRSNNRLGRLSECSKLTCFAKEKATWFLGGEIDDQHRLLSGVLAGRRASWEGENSSRTTCPNSKHEEKNPSLTHAFECRRVRVREP